MSEKTLKFNNIKVNKKEFHKSKQAIELDLVDTGKIVVSDRFRHSEEGFKYFYENKYLKAKAREFNGNIKTNFLGNNVPKENTYYTCIACITLDSVLKMNKKNYPQVYLEECKYKVKKIHTPRFINIELESDPESDAETDLESNATTEN